MKLLRLLVQRSPSLIAMASLMGLLAGAATAGLLALINLTIRGENPLPDHLQIGVFLGLCLVVLITTAGSLAAVAGLAQRIVFELQLDLIRQILNSSLARLEEIGSAKLLAALSGDVEAISRAAPWAAGVAINFALLLACGCYLAWLSPVVFVSLVVFLVVAAVSYSRLVQFAYTYARNAREIRDRLFSHFRSVTEGCKELKLHAERRQAFEEDLVIPDADEFKRNRIWSTSIAAGAGTWGVILFFLAIGMVLFVLPGPTNLSAELAGSFALTIIFMITPLRGLLNALPELQQASVALEKINSLGFSLNSAPDLDKEPRADECPVGQREWESIRLHEVTYTYREEGDAQFSLGPLDFRWERGELIFLVGGNGSGKSTLIKLLIGLYPSATGHIAVDETPINSAMLSWYREQFSVVFHDYFLFDSLLGFAGTNTDVEAQEYLRRLRLDDKVQIDNRRFSTTALSAGQRKRLALLTAYVEDRPIYVFDEWAADQDPDFKAVFYRQLLPDLKSRGKTVLVATHDDRYFDCADRIIKLNDGQIDS